MNLNRVYRHKEAEKITKALLKSLKMSDVAYIELKTLGARFVCGRCCDKEPMIWDEMVSVIAQLHAKTNRRCQIEHYRQEAQSWNEANGRVPEFEPKYPVTFVNVHDPDLTLGTKPFTLLLAEEGVADLIESSPRSDWNYGCIPCHNYGRSHVFNNTVDTLAHLRDV
jgi:hypothetical protein